MEITMANIGKRIRERRLELNLTQNDIHRECGIASGALSQIENGTRTPTITTFYALSKALKCSMDWLFTGICSTCGNFEIHEDEKKVLLDLRRLPEDDKHELVAILEIKLRKEKPL